MNLQSTIEVYGGGPGSGCQGQNCGRLRSKTEEKPSRKALGQMRRATKLTQKQYLKKQYGTKYQDFIGRPVTWSGRDHEIRVAKAIHES